MIGWRPVDDVIENATKRLAACLQHVENSPYFVAPRAFSISDPTANLEAILGEVDRVCDERIADFLGLQDLAWTDEVLAPGSGWVESAPTLLQQLADDEGSLLSWAFGVAIGRFSDESLVQQPSAPEPLVALPVSVPAESHNETVGPSSRFIRVSDPGHPADIGSAIVVVLEDAAALFPHVRDRLLALSDREQLQAWLRSKFFSDHLSQYSMSGRRAPLYWPLGTRSGSFVVWLYAHRVSQDTLFRVVHDFVRPKIVFEEGRLADLTSEGKISAEHRRRTAAQKQLLDELRELQETLETVAPLWQPDLIDGFAVVLAPMWRLFVHHRAWADELRGHWHKLARGEYDWSRLAMRLWPERVVPLCAQDRSIAIAHGVEDVFWVTNPRNSSAWVPRSLPTRAISELVAQRHDVAIKAALDRVAAP